VTERERRRAEFLAGAGWATAQRHPLPSDASFRSYHRLEDAGRRAMLMDAPPPQEDVRPFCRVASLLHRLDYSAPNILAADIEGGFLLLEDLGDGTYTRLLDRGADERALYGLAIDLLADLHARFDPAASHGLAEYDDRKLLDEAALLVDWFMPAASGSAVPDALRADYLGLWAAALPVARSVPAGLVLRDYHIDNLMHLPDRTGLAACGLLDFQDAVIGPISYDLISLIEDARRDVSPPLAEALWQRYLAARPRIDPAALRSSAAVIGAQRHAKIVGIFCRLARRDGKPDYLKHLPRVWRLLQNSLDHPALAPLAQWFDRHIPAASRGIPPIEGFRV